MHRHQPPAYFSIKIRNLAMNSGRWVCLKMGYIMIYPKIAIVIAKLTMPHQVSEVPYFQTDPNERNPTERVGPVKASSLNRARLKQHQRCIRILNHRKKSPDCKNSMLSDKPMSILHGSITIVHCQTMLNHVKSPNKLIIVKSLHRICSRYVSPPKSAKCHGR